MNHLRIIIANFLKLSFRKPIHYFFYFVLPVLSFIVMTLIFSLTNNRVLVIGYQNHDRGELGGALVAYLDRAARNELHPIDAALMETKILEGSISAFLEIPEDYSQKISLGGAPSLRLAAIQDAAEAQALKAEIDFFTGSLEAIYRAANGDERRSRQLREEFLTADIALTVSSVKDESVRRTAGSISFGILLYIGFLQASLITSLMLREKENHSYLRIKLAPIREIVYAAGNGLAAFFILAAQTLISLSILVFILRIDLTLPWPIAMTLLLGFSLSAIGFGVMLTGLSRSLLQATLISNLGISVSSMLSGCFWPIDFMPDFIQRAAVIFPQTWVMRAINKLQSGGSFAEISFTIPLLLAFALFFFAVYAYAMSQEKDARRFG